MTRAAIFYELSEATVIELQSCVCKHCFIGPDCAELGIFNYNNKVFFTHKILDEYTSAFARSKTPFSSWIQVVARRFALRGGAFCSKEIFISAWFAYA